MSKIFYPILVFIFLAGCGSDPNFSAAFKESTSSSGSSERSVAAGSNSVRIRLDSESFMQIDDPLLSATGAICPGDAKKYYKPLVLDGTGSPIPLQETSSSYIDDGDYGQRPSFIHNVSVDLTNANLYGAVHAAATALSGLGGDPASEALFTSNIKPQLKIAFDNCSYRYHSKLKSSYCAAFDSPISQFANDSGASPNTSALLLGLSYSSTSSMNAYLKPSETSLLGANTPLVDTNFRYVQYNVPASNSFYKLLDAKLTNHDGEEFYTCADQGVIQSGVAEETRLYVGGVDIDINRSELSARENLLMHLTYIPMGKNDEVESPNYTPGDGRRIAYDNHSEAVFKVHLMSLGDATPTVTRAIAQPRHLTYSNEIYYPKTISSLSVLTRPYGQIRDEQLVIPLSTNSSINRIRIERVQGSAVLLEVSLYRLGAKF